MTSLGERLWHRCFPVNFANFLRTSFFIKTPPVAASQIKWMIATKWIEKAVKQTKKLLIKVEFFVKLWYISNKIKPKQ